MRHVVASLALTATLGGCGLFHAAQPHRPPATTTAWGNWVLRHPDSTSFAGASLVELALQPGTFQLTATYPGAAPVVISGSATLTDNGLLTIVPESGVNVSSDQWHAFRFVQGQPITLLTSAAGNSMVFAPPGQRVDPTPSSVWNRVEAARAAGYVTGTARDTTHR